MKRKLILGLCLLLLAAIAMAAVEMVVSRHIGVFSNLEIAILLAGGIVSTSIALFGSILVISNHDSNREK